MAAKDTETRHVPALQNLQVERKESSLSYMLITQQHKHAFSSKHNSLFIGRTLVPFQSLSHLLNISSANPFPPEDLLDLSIEQILAAAQSMKDDLQRQANRSILRNDMPRALGALCSIEAVDSFVYALKIRAGSQLGLPKKPKRKT
jgi:hypothetical protein